MGRFDQWTHGKKLFRNMTVGFALHEMIYDADGAPEDYRFLMVNHAFENMTGLKRAEIIGRRATEVVPGLERSWIEAYGEVTRTGKPAWFQSYSAPLDRYYEVRAYRPDPGIFAVMVQDISERLKDEEALANRERLFRAVLDTTGEGFFMADAEGRLVEVNGAYSDMQGYSRQELLSMSIFDQGAGYARDQVWRRLEAIRKEGHNTFEAVHLRKDGRLVDVEISATWIKEGGGRYIAFVRDITDRKRAERLIREQGERLALALNGTAAGIWDWDMGTGDLILDDSFGRVIGYPPEELVGQKKDRWREICHPEDLARSAACLEAHLSGKAPRYECEVRLRHKDGRWVWVLNQGELVERDAEGRPSRMIGIMFDIGRQKDTEETLRTALADKDSLLRELHHRTKNSMQLINAMLELKKRELPAGEVTAAFDNIQNKVLAMALVQEKLYEADTLSSIDLGSYVRDLVGLLESEMPLASTDIAFEAEAEEIEVTADVAVPCGIIVSELVGNSISHAFPSRERGRITVSVKRSPSGEISIEERDDGVGLPEGYDPRKEGRVGLRTVIGIGEEQLHGRVDFDGKPGGFACRLAFKNLYYPKRV